MPEKQIGSILSQNELKDTGGGGLVAKSCPTLATPRTVAGPTLATPMDRSWPGSSVHGVFQARILEWIAISFSRRSSWVSCIASRFFTDWAMREAQKILRKWYKHQKLRLIIIKSPKIIWQSRERFGKKAALSEMKIKTRRNTRVNKCNK